MYQTEQTDTSDGKKVIWDFSQCHSLHPVFLSALSILKQGYGDIVSMRDINPEISDYLNSVYFHSPLVIYPIENDESIWQKYDDKSYLPICSFCPYDSSSVKVQELVQTTIKHQLPKERKLHGVLSLILSELIDNITEHSNSNQGFVFCHTYPSDKTLYVIISDTGRSIFASYASDERYSSSLTNRESSGLLLALSGKSTKDRPENENRGYGISRSRGLIVNGLGGEFYILSGSAFVRYDSNGESIADLPQDYRWNGTLILLKIPTGITNDFDIYQYIS